VRSCVILVALLVTLAAGCDFMFTNDMSIGRRCSAADECPRAQRCSAAGQCLERCAVPDCVGDQCGCTGRESTNDDKVPTADASCLDDGLCHFTCDLQGCPVEMRCVSGVCLAGCPDGWCPDGRTCENASQPVEAYCRD